MSVYALWINCASLEGVIPPLRETRLTCVAHHMLNVVYYQRHGIYFYYIYYICVLYTSKCISLYIYVYIYIYMYFVQGSVVPGCSGLAGGSKKSGSSRYGRHTQG